MRNHDSDTVGPLNRQVPFVNRKGRGQDRSPVCVMIVTAPDFHSIERPFPNLVRSPRNSLMTSSCPMRGSRLPIHIREKTEDCGDELGGLRKQVGEHFRDDRSWLSCGARRRCESISRTCSGCTSRTSRKSTGCLRNSNRHHQRQRHFLHKYELVPNRQTRPESGL